MRMWFSAAMGAALLGLAALPSGVLGQQKTVKACQDEWRANKANNQAKGITEKAYVAQCRAGGASAQPKSAPAPMPAPSPSIAVPAPKKTVKACQDEWRANKADNQAKGITEKAYVAQCRAGGSSAQPTSAPAAIPAPTPSAATPAPKKTVKACQDEWRANKPAYQAARITEKAYVDKCRAGESVALPTAPTAAPTPAPTTPAPAPAPPPTPAAKSSPPLATPPAGAGQFQSEAQAKSQCPTDLVVWVNLTSKIYHFAGNKNYGTTKAGAYMCEKEATAQGFRASKTEKRPSAGS
jgi:hypothetical protein